MLTRSKECSATQNHVEWTVIGGGIHGVHLAAMLLATKKTNIHTLRIVDPGEKLLERWVTCTAVTGMTHLRSPVVHHVGPRPFELLEYAQKKPADDNFTPPYQRPSLSLFNEHAENVVERYELKRAHIQAHATGIHLCGFGEQDSSIHVELSNGESLHTERIVLALGSGDRPLWPSWAPKDHPRIRHIFDNRQDPLEMCPSEEVAVIGGGITAAQVALRLLAQGQKVHLLTRHDFRCHPFDSEPGWLGPKYLDRFWRDTDYGSRRQSIQNARHRGSIPPDTFESLMEAIEGEALISHRGHVQALDEFSSRLHLRLSDQASLDVDRIVLATGFEPRRPGGKMLDELVESGGLPCAECGFPIVDKSLRWHPQVYVSGALAELELGPAARNIAGARAAAERVAGILR